ncbi:MAG: site-specific DNA-methyltransferase [Desulfococcaceae bacterium]
MTVKSIKHSKEKRVHIPSKEEAGYELVNEKVMEKQVSVYPKNPVVSRGNDPELFWMNKYGSDDQEDKITLDIRSLYRHEHISPEMLISRLYEIKESEGHRQSDIFDQFGNGFDVDELEKPTTYYSHDYLDKWSNRMILGDSLLVMNSLLEREFMSGKVQMIYIDPPYGIKYGSNWQMKLSDRNVTDGKDEHVSGEPEQIKAYRDTWELGIHSYLSYLRDRLLVAKNLLTESGSCFVQISDENVHLVRCLMDEVFGSGNFVSLITVKKTGGMGESLIDNISDYLIWYAKEKSYLKYRNLYQEKDLASGTGARYNQVELKEGDVRPIKREEQINPKLLPKDSKVYLGSPLTSQTPSDSTLFEFEFNGNRYKPNKGGWKTNYDGMMRLIQKNRIISTKTYVNYKMYFDDFPYTPINNLWADTMGTAEQNKKYVVQTAIKVIQRCILMTTDPGDLILDPTCGSGTTAYVAEQWGRRWITIDTSRIALNIAKTRIMTATFPYYKLHDPKEEDIRQGFEYKKVPHITLKSLANDEPAEEETLYDQPFEDKKKLRVSGPFTVETLQSLDVMAPESVIQKHDPEDKFENRIFEHLLSAGVKNGIRNEQAVFTRVDALSSPALHAEGFYQSAQGERKAYIHIGPKFGTVSKSMVSEAVKEARMRGDADWLIILGFSFESDISSQNVTTRLGSFEVSKVRMHDDLMQEGLLKKDKKAASFVTIGEPDLRLHKNPKDNTAQVEILGLDIYDPVKDEVKDRNIKDIAFWMLDEDYDGSSFIVKQVFFCGGEKKEFEAWKKGLDRVAAVNARKNAEKLLKIEIDEHAFDRLYSHTSQPFAIKKKGQKIAVRVISQFGEEAMKVLSAE